jgi:hypothetical protein
MSLCLGLLKLGELDKTLKKALIASLGWSKAD